MDIKNLRKGKKSKIDSVKEDFEPVAIEGKSKLAVHMLRERNSSIVKRIKDKALSANPMLNCEVCGFSFYEKYGELS